MLCDSSVIDYLNMRDEGGLVKGLVKVEIACFGQHNQYFHSRQIKLYSLN